MGILSWLGLARECEHEPVALDDGNFVAEVRRSDVPVLVDVWSNGCQPCIALAPTIRQLACKYDGQIKVAQINASASPKTMKKLGVQSTPTVVFFKKGAVVEKVVGLRGQHYYEEIIDEDLLEQPIADVG